MSLINPRPARAYLVMMIMMMMMIDDDDDNDDDVGDAGDNDVSTKVKILINLPIIWKRADISTVDNFS